MKKKKEYHMLNASCQSCGNESGFDKKSLRASTYNINGCDIVLCVFCEDDLLVKLAKGRGIIIKLGEGGEVESVKQLKPVIQVPVYYCLPFTNSKKVLIDEESIKEEFDIKLKALIKEANKRNKDGTKKS